MDQTSLVSWLGHGAKLKPSACLPGLATFKLFKKKLKVKRSDFDP
jgi:hypothetical protein